MKKQFCRTKTRQNASKHAQVLLTVLVSALQPLLRSKNTSAIPRILHQVLPRFLPALLIFHSPAGSGWCTGAASVDQLSSSNSGQARQACICPNCTTADKRVTSAAACPATFGSRDMVHSVLNTAAGAAESCATILPSSLEMMLMEELPLLLLVPLLKFSLLVECLPVALVPPTRKHLLQLPPVLELPVPQRRPSKQPTKEPPCSGCFLLWSGEDLKVISITGPAGDFLALPNTLH